MPSIRYPLNPRRPIQGEGLKDIYDFIAKRVKVTLEGPRIGPTKRMRDFLDTTGSQPIIKLELSKKPIEGPVSTALNILSLGGFDRARRKLGYDTVDHAYMLATLADGKTYVVHKNEIVEEREATAQDLANPRYNIPLPQDHELNLRDLLNNAAKKDAGLPASAESEKRFWNYDPKDSNCQGFVKQLVEDNGLHPTDPATIKALQPQDSKALIDSLGPLSHVPKAITTLASVLDRTKWGDGLKLRRGSGLTIRQIILHHP